jgi:hypothetical protein
MTTASDLIKARSWQLQVREDLTVPTHTLEHI